MKRARVEILIMKSNVTIEKAFSCADVKFLSFSGDLDNLFDDKIQLDIAIITNQLSLTRL